MKKQWFVIALCCLLSCFALCACAETVEEEPHPLTEYVLSIAQDGEELIHLTEDDLLDLIGIEPQEYTDFVYLAATNALTGREIIVLKAVDEEAAERLAELLQAYLEQRMNEMRNYLPEVYQILSKAEVLRKDLTLVLSMAAPTEDEPLLLLEPVELPEEAAADGV
ncbi:MAG: DUF4358 domain-containing protein [Clostridia bacterium]|nr:DUF4358 domain-containing protein [Clostridia bacterium]